MIPKVYVFRTHRDLNILNLPLYMSYSVYPETHISKDDYVTILLVSNEETESHLYIFYHTCRHQSILCPDRSIDQIQDQQRRT